MCAAYVMYDTNGCCGLKQICEHGWMINLAGSDASAAAALCVLALIRHLVHQLVAGVLDAAAV